MTRVVVVFANLGKVRVVERHKTEESIRRIAAKIRSLRVPIAHLLTAEVEPFELEMLLDALPGFEAHNTESHEPVFTRGAGVKRARWIHVRNTAVKRWSPPRGLSEVIVDGGEDPDTAVIGTHHPVNYGDRAPKAQRALDKARAKMVKRGRRRIRWHRFLGRHNVYGGDVNDRHPVPPHKRAVRLFGDGFDHGWIIPARGWVAEVRQLPLIDLTIEPQHDGLWAEVTLRRVDDDTTTS